MTYKNHSVFIHSEIGKQDMCVCGGKGLWHVHMSVWLLKSKFSGVFCLQLKVEVRKFEVRKSEIYLRNHFLTQNHCDSVNRLSNTMRSGPGTLQSSALK